MIRTVTLNPSIDYAVSLDELKTGATNRSKNASYTAAGKGINVSRMLKNLGVDSTAFIVTAGNTGELYKKTAKEYGINTEYFNLESGETRINIKISAGKETEINAKGPTVNDKEAQMIIDAVSDVRAGDVLVLSGSIPCGMPEDTYCRIMEKAAAKKAKIAADTHGNALRWLLSYRPFIIKPNAAELGELFKTEIKTAKDATYYGRKLMNEGAENVLVSMGADGAVFITAQHEYVIKAPKGKVVSTVGSGDSMLAGYIAAVINGFDEYHAAAYSVACGSGSAFSCEFATKKDVENIYSLLTLH